MLLELQQKILKYLHFFVQKENIQDKSYPLPPLLGYPSRESGHCLESIKPLQGIDHIKEMTHNTDIQGRKHTTKKKTQRNTKYEENLQQ